MTDPNIRLVCSTCGNAPISDETFATIKPGSFVKTIDNEERFWVKVSAVDESGVVGTVDNDLVNEHSFSYGDEIRVPRGGIIEAIR